MKVLETVGLTRRFGSLTAVHSLSLTFGFGDGFHPAARSGRRAYGHRCRALSPACRLRNQCRMTRLSTTFFRDSQSAHRSLKP